MATLLPTVLPTADEEAAAAGQRPLQRFVSSLGRCLPAGVHLERQPLNIQLPSAAAQQQSQAHQQQQQPQARQPQQPLPRQPQQAARQQQQQQRALPPRSVMQNPQVAGRASSPKPPRDSQSPQPPQQQRVSGPAAQVVPGQPLKLRLKFSKREGSVERRVSPAIVAGPSQQQLLQSVRQLGTAPLLSPLPAGWAEVVRSSPPPSVPAQAAATQQLQQLAHQQEAAAIPSAPTAVAAAAVVPLLDGRRSSGVPSPFESVSAEEYEEMVSGGSGKQAAAQQQPTPFASVTGPEAVAAQAPGQAQQQAQQKEQQQAQPQQAAQQQRMRCSPDVLDAAADGGAKRPAGAAPAAPAAPSAGAAPAALEAAPPPKRPRPAGGSAAPSAVIAARQGASQPVAAAAAGSHVPAAETQQRKKQRQEESRPRQRTPPLPPAPSAPAAPVSRSDGTSLGEAAALLPAALDLGAGNSSLPGSNMVQPLQVRAGAGSAAWLAAMRACAAAASVES